MQPWAPRVGGVVGARTRAMVVVHVTGLVMASRPGSPRVIPQPLGPRPASPSPGWAVGMIASLMVTTPAPSAGAIVRAHRTRRVNSEVARWRSNR